MKYLLGLCLFAVCGSAFALGPVQEQAAPEVYVEDPGTGMFHRVAESWVYCSSEMISQSPKPGWVRLNNGWYRNPAYISNLRQGAIMCMKVK